MRTGRKHSGFGTPLEHLPHRSDQVCCSNWDSAGEFVEESGLPIDRFYWSREINQDTGEWWIHGEVSPTLKEKLIGRWLWLKVKLRLKRRVLGGAGWHK
jgi:hypothetical protein